MPTTRTLCAWGGVAAAWAFGAATTAAHAQDAPPATTPRPTATLLPTPPPTPLPAPPPTPLPTLPPASAALPPPEAVGVGAQRGAYIRGRPPPADPVNGVLWVPRVLLFPLFAVSEFLLRDPIVALGDALDRSHGFAYVNKVLHPVADLRWTPTLVVDFGVLTSGGLRFTWTHALAAPNALSGVFATGGPGFWHARLVDEVRLRRATFGVVGDFFTRPDRPYYGYGNGSNIAARTNYALTVGDAHAFVELRPSFHFWLHVDAGYRYEATGPGLAPSVDAAAVSPATFPGFGAAMNLLVARASVAVDTRGSYAARSGVRWDASCLYAYDVTDANRSWLAAQSDLSFALQVLAPDRVLALDLWAMDTQPLGSEPVPLPEQAVLGHDHLPGFLWGRYVDTSALTAELTYRYPLWQFVDAVWLGSVGNVFGDHFTQFQWGKLAGTLGLGFETRSDRSEGVRLFLALGTTRFDEPFRVDSVRVNFIADARFLQ